MNASCLVLATVTVAAAAPAFADGARESAAARAFRAFSACDESTIPDLRAAYAPARAELRTTTARDGTRTTALEPPLNVGGVALTAWTDSRVDLGELGGAHEWGFVSPQPPQAVRDGLRAHVAQADALVAHGGYARIEYRDGARWVVVRKPAANGRVVRDEFFGAPMRVFEIHPDDRQGDSVTRVLCHFIFQSPRDAKPRRASLN